MPEKRVPASKAVSAHEHGGCWLAQQAGAEMLEIKGRVNRITPAYTRARQAGAQYRPEMDKLLKNSDNRAVGGGV